MKDRDLHLQRLAAIKAVRDHLSGKSEYLDKGAKARAFSIGDQVVKVPATNPKDNLTEYLNDIKDLKEKPVYSKMIGSRAFPETLVETKKGAYSVQPKALVNKSGFSGQAELEDALGKQGLFADSVPANVGKDPKTGLLKIIDSGSLEAVDPNTADAIDFKDPIKPRDSKLAKDLKHRYQVAERLANRQNKISSKTAGTLGKLSRKLPVIGPLIGLGAAALTGEDASAAIPILSEAEALGPRKGSLADKLESGTITPEERLKLRKLAIDKLRK